MGRPPSCPLALLSRKDWGYLWGFNKGSRSPLGGGDKEETQDGGREMKWETVN